MLKKTLSYDRPVIATIDNDEQGKRVCERLPHTGFNMDLITLVPMPSIVTPIQYPSGHKGGSFEEMFPPRDFINQVFSSNFMPETLVRAKSEFSRQFIENKSWFEQAKKFCAERGYFKIGDFKVRIGMCLAKASKKVPPDIKKLSKIVRDVRQKQPVRHLTDIAMESESSDPKWE